MMKKINNFHTSWTIINDIMHDMKNALETSYLSELKSREARKRIGKGIDSLYKAIDEMANGDNGNDKPDG